MERHSFSLKDALDRRKSQSFLLEGITNREIKIDKNSKKLAINHNKSDKYAFKWLKSRD